MKSKTVLKYLSTILSLVLMVSLASCGGDDDDDNNDDDAEPVDPLVGTYEFTSATFTSDVVVVINNPADPTQVVPAPFTSGDDATALLKGSIEGAAECSAGVKVGIDLREDGSSYYVCEGETVETLQGSWQVNNDTKLFTLRINSLGVDVIMQNFTLANGVLSGNAVIPLPRDAQVDLTTGEQLTATGDPLTQGSVDLLAAGGVTVDVGDLNIQTPELTIVFTAVSF
ncbi:MAG: hypothetical protein RJQ09_12400 [Cyclobacteriaceae bacterium]